MRPCRAGSLLKDLFDRLVLARIESISLLGNNQFHTVVFQVNFDLVKNDLEGANPVVSAIQRAQGFIEAGQRHQERVPHLALNQIPRQLFKIPGQSFPLHTHLLQIVGLGAVRLGQWFELRLHALEGLEENTKAFLVGGGHSRKGLQPFCDLAAPFLPFREALQKRVKSRWMSALGGGVTVAGLAVGQARNCGECDGFNCIICHTEN